MDRSQVPGKGWGCGWPNSGILHLPWGKVCSCNSVLRELGPKNSRWRLSSRAFWGLRVRLGLVGLPPGHPPSSKQPLGSWPTPPEEASVTSHCERSSLPLSSPHNPDHQKPLRAQLSRGTVWALHARLAAPGMWRPLTGGWGL